MIRPRGGKPVKAQKTQQEKKYTRKQLAEADKALADQPPLIPGSEPTTGAATLAQRDWNRANRIRR